MSGLRKQPKTTKGRLTIKQATFLRALNIQGTVIYENMENKGRQMLSRHTVFDMQYTT